MSDSLMSPAFQRSGQSAKCILRAYTVHARADLQQWQLCSQHWYRKRDADISHYCWQRHMKTKLHHQLCKT